MRIAYYKGKMPGWSEMSPKGKNIEKEGGDGRDGTGGDRTSALKKSRSPRREVGSASSIQPAAWPLPVESQVSGLTGFVSE